MRKVHTPLTLGDPESGLLAIVNAIEPELPSGSKLHLFGVKGSALSSLKMFDSIGSVDSMAFDFRARVKARAEGVSNSMAYRADQMSHWMAAASSRVAPSVNDQFRLNLNGGK